ADWQMPAHAVQAGGARAASRTRALAAALHRQGEALLRDSHRGGPRAQDRKSLLRREEHLPRPPGKRPSGPDAAHPGGNLDPIEALLHHDGGPCLEGARGLPGSRGPRWWIGATLQQFSGSGGTDSQGRVIPRLPQPVWAVLRALRLEDPEYSALTALDDSGWRQALDFTDRAQLTLALSDRLAAAGLGGRLPAAIRGRLERNLADNTKRTRRIRELVAEISGRFSVAGVEFVILKGLTHCPDFVADPRLRVQYDIDFYCPPGSLDGAREILLGMGYEPIMELDSFPLDHLPT